MRSADGSSRIETYFKGIYVVCNKNKLRTFALDKGRYAPNARCDDELVGLLWERLPVGLCVSDLEQARLVLFLRLRGVLTSEIEYFIRKVPRDRVHKLIDGGGNLETPLQDCLLSLDANLAWPSDERGQVKVALAAALILGYSKGPLDIAARNLGHVGIRLNDLKKVNLNLFVFFKF